MRVNSPGEQALLGQLIVAGGRKAGEGCALRHELQSPPRDTRHSPPSFRPSTTPVAVAVGQEVAAVLAMGSPLNMQIVNHGLAIPPAVGAVTAAAGWRRFSPAAPALPRSALHTMLLQVALDVGYCQPSHLVLHQG